MHIIGLHQRVPLRYWFILAMGAGVVAGAVGGCFMPVSEGDPVWGPPVVGALLGAMVGSVFVFGIPYLVIVARDLRGLHVPAELLQADEVVLLTSPGSVVHHRGGRPRLLWGQAGGKLFLTNQRLLFRTHWGQPSSYLLALPVAAMREMTFARVSGSVPNGLRVETDAGQVELFNLGVLWPTALWVGAVGALRQAALPHAARRAAPGVASPATNALLHRATAISYARGHHGIVGAEDILAVFLLEPSRWPPGVTDLAPPEVLRVIRALAPPLDPEAVAEADRVPDAEEKLVIHHALEARTTPGPLEPHHVWAGVLRHNSKLVRAILSALDLDRAELLEAAGRM